MKTLAVLPALLLLVAAAPGLFAQEEPEILVFMHIEDEPLDKAATRVGLVGGVEVEVEAALREKRITLDLEDPVEEALARLAAAAGAHLVRRGPKSFAIRSQASPDGAEQAPPEPAWIAAFRKRLEETEVEFLWAGDPLPGILAWVSAKSGVPVRLDPRVLREKSKEDLEIHIAEYDENLKASPIRASAARALDMALSYPTLDLARAWRFGGVYVSSREHIRSLPPEASYLDRDAAPKVSVKLANATLAKALEKLGKEAGVKIGLDRDLRQAFRSERLDFEVEDLPLPDALGLLLAPRGLVAVPSEKGLVVRRVPE